MIKTDSIVELSAALVKAQKEMGKAVKASKNPFFHSTYADLSSVMEACKDALNNNGLSIMQLVETDERGTYVDTILLHETAEYISSRLYITIKEQNNPQALGSAISYARRYSLQSMLFIPAEDDDAESATHEDTVEVKRVNTSTSNSCDMCGTTNKYHKKGCLNSENIEIAN